MELTQEQFDKIRSHVPRQRGNVSMDNLQVVNAFLYMTENGCTWRALPKFYGNWHTVYVRMNRWSKSGVLPRLFEAFQTEGVIRIRRESLCLDSTSVKVHPDGCGALKKRGNKVSDGQEEDSPPQFIGSPPLIVRLELFLYPAATPPMRWKAKCFLLG